MSAGAPDFSFGALQPKAKASVHEIWEEQKNIYPILVPGIAGLFIFLLLQWNFTILVICVFFTAVLSASLIYLYFIQHQKIYVGISGRNSSYSASKCREKPRSCHDRHHGAAATHYILS